jgi:hypothetical protein
MPAARTTLAVAVAGLALVVLVLAVPFATEERALPAAIPQPAPLSPPELVAIPPGGEACLRGVTVDPRSELAEVRVATYGQPAIPFRLRLRGEGGWRTAARAPRGYADNATLRLPVDPPPAPVRATACVRNEGESPLALYGAADRTRTAVVTTVDGAPQPATAQLAFYERAPATLAERAPEIAERVATFRPVGPWLVWVLGGLVLVGVPVLLVVALARAARGG